MFRVVPTEKSPSFNKRQQVRTLRVLDSQQVARPCGGR